MNTIYEFNLQQILLKFIFLIAKNKIRYLLRNIMIHIHECRFNINLDQDHKFLKSILSCQNNKKIINTLIPFIASLSSDQMCPMRLKWYPVMKNTTSYLVSVNVPFYFILTVSIYNSQTTVKYFKHIMNNVVQSFKQMTLILYTHKL